MLRRKGTPSASSSGAGLLPTSLSANGKGRGGGGVNQRRASSNKYAFSIQSVTSHLIVAIVVFVFAYSSSSSDLPTRQMMSTNDLLNSASAYIPHFCPTTLTEYLNWSGNRLPEERRHAPLQRVQPATVPSKMTPVPDRYRKTFYYDGETIEQPVARALRSRGWQQVDDRDNAHVIYTYANNAHWSNTLQPWQRFNYIPGYRKWNKKDSFAYYYKQWEARHSHRQPSVYVPETYLLTESEEEILAFAKVLKDGGSKYPWVHKEANVNQGRGITILAPESKQLLQLPEKHLSEVKKSADDDEGDVIIQRYVCNEMTWDRRKFDVRMFWMVASLDPLIILYHDGYVRIGNSEYNEKDFSDTTSHLTTHTGLGSEGKATMDDFAQVLNKVYNAQQGSKRPKLAAESPMAHVRNQFKHALGEMSEVFLAESFKKPDFREITSENGFNFYCADYILDNDLDVFFIEPQNGCGLDEDYYFRLEMHGSLFNGMVDVLEEIGQKQEAGLPIMPLEKAGNWEVIYADGLVYQYDGYQRSKNKASCSTN